MDLIIAVDFDGTIVEHEYPKVGAPVPNAIETLKWLQEKEVKLILWTMRSDNRDDGSSPLMEAVEFCEKQGIEFWGINQNPTQHNWTGSPKAYAHRYIDDAALGCPLVYTSGKPPYVDWVKIREELEKMLEAERDL